MINFEAVKIPDEQEYQEVIRFCNQFASGDRACDPELEQGTYIPIEHVRNGHLFMMVGRGVGHNQIVCVFWVHPKTGEAVLPAFLPQYAEVAITVGLPEAQKHCASQMWCAPVNPMHAEWILSTGWADVEKWNKEGIITWSHQL